MDAVTIFEDFLGFTICVISRMSFSVIGRNLVRCSVPLYSLMLIIAFRVRLLLVLDSFLSYNAKKLLLFFSGPHFFTCLVDLPSSNWIFPLSLLLTLQRALLCYLIMLFIVHFLLFSASCHTLSFFLFSCIIDNVWIEQLRIFSFNKIFS